MAASKMLSRRSTRRVLCGAALTLVSARGLAEEPPHDDVFGTGDLRVSLLVGAGSTGLDDYVIIGAGVGYFVLPGVELGLDYEAWLVGEPVLNRVAPETRYVFVFVPTVKPYVGAFYRHTFVAGEDDLDSLGGRAGLFYVPSGGRVFLGGGVAYEHYLSCGPATFVDCDAVYPEIAIGATL